MLTILTLVLGALLLLIGCGGDNWYESYDPSEDQPYGTSLLPKILQARYPDATYENLPLNWTTNGLDSTGQTLYIAVGGGLKYTYTEAEALAMFIEQGGHAFLAAKEVSNRFLSYVISDSCLKYKSFLPNARFDSLELVESATGAVLMMPVLREKRGSSEAGNYLNALYYNCLLGAEHLLMIHQDTVAFRNKTDAEYPRQPIMSRFSYGEGALTILSYPKALTNVYATDSLGRQTMEEVLKLLPDSVAHVAYDARRRSSTNATIRDNVPRSDNSLESEGNILKHVLARPPLATAWYLLILGAIVFLVFGAKRRQRLIPLVQPRKNTTHQHLGNISRLYLTQPNNMMMASKQFALFDAYCNRRFGLRPLHDDADFERFSKMAGVNEKYLETLKRYQSTVARNQPISNTGFVSIVRILQATYKGIGRRFD